MSDLIQIILSLIGGGFLGQIISLIINRRKRRKEGIESYSETIDMLLESNARLIAEQVVLREQIARLRAIPQRSRAIHKPLYHRSSRHAPQLPDADTTDPETAEVDPLYTDPLDEPP